MSEGLTLPKRAIDESKLPDTSVQGIPDADQLAAICKALGHPARVKIVNFLKKADRCMCGKIVDLFPLAQSTVSQHLKCLKEAGLIKGEVEGVNTCYCLDKETLDKFKKAIEAL